MPVPNYSLSRLERLYLQEQPVFGTIVGAPSNNEACRFIRMKLTNETAVIPRPDKTGSRSQTVGIKGRTFARWNMEMSLVAGTVGVVPDCNPLLIGLFGKDPVIAAGASVTYTFDDAIPLTTIWSFRQPSTLDQRAIHSAVVQEATFNLGQDSAAIWSCQGEAAAMVTSNGFAAADLITKAGLVAFPTEPVAPVTNGGIIAGFTGQVTIEGDVIAVIRTATIRVQTQNMLVKDTFGSYYPTLTEGGERTIQTAFSLYDSDDASTEAIKQASYDKVPATIIYQIGTVAGNIWTFTLSNVQLTTYDLNDQQLRFAVDMGESRSYASSLTSKDEMSLVIT